MFPPVFVDVDIEITRLYVSSPDQTLRYVVTIRYLSPPELYTRRAVKSLLIAMENPLEKSRSNAVENGIGNAESSSGSKKDVANYAYETLHLYKLRVPLPLVELRENYNLAPPQRFVYLPRRLFEGVAWEKQEKLF